MGFEPTDALTSPVFKTGAFDHSAISPCVKTPLSIPNAGYRIPYPPLVVKAKAAACEKIFEKIEIRACKMEKGVVL